MVIAVTGAAGQLGQLVIRSLKTNVAPSEIVALVRNPAAVVGAPGPLADYSKPGTLDATLHGVDILLLISSNEIGQRTQQHLNVIEAVARQTGRDIRYLDLPEADFAAALLSAGLPDVYAHGIASWSVGASKGALFDGGEQLSRLIGRPSTAFGASVAASLVEQDKAA